MLSTKLIIILAISTSLLFLATISPFFLHETLAQWPGSWQKQMFSSICHQNLSRTLHVNEIPAAVCARCLGIYAFLSIGFIFVPVLKRFFIKKFRYSQAILLFAVLIMLADYGMQWLNMYEGTNLIRLSTGLVLGLSTTVFIIYKK